MFKLILLSGAVALLTACSGMSGMSGGGSGSSAMGASGVGSSGGYDSPGDLPRRRGGPLGASTGGPN